MNRRTLLQGAAMATIAAPRLAGAQGRSVLRFVPSADLSILDPIRSGSFNTRIHALTVFETLYGVDIEGNPQPQMLEGHAIGEDGKIWNLTLREGLRFHDGEPVRAQDVVASLRRWSQRDPFGQALFAATDELSAASDRVVRFRLKYPFPLLPQALGKASPNLPVIMPERFGAIPPANAVPEMIGSGPYRFVASERVPGARAVYAKFDAYVPRPSGTPSFLAGPRIAHFERVEWLTIPDASTAAAALQRGEVDWVEQPSIDLVPLLKRDRQINVQVVETAGLMSVLRFNHFQLPLDNIRIRRVLLNAVSQRDFMMMIAGDQADYWRDGVGIFTPGSAMANDAGLPEIGGRSMDQLRRDLEAAGYKGERIALMAPTDQQRTNAVSEATGDLLRRLGMNLDHQAMDMATMFTRNQTRNPLEQGGWSMFATFWGGLEMSSPASHHPLRGAGTRSWVGWPTSERIEELVAQWFRAPDLAEQQRLCRELQLQAFQDVPYVPLGQFFPPSAWRRTLTGILPGLPQMTNVRRV